MPKNKEQGSALITALFIMTLVAIAATAMSTRLQLDIYRTHLNLVSKKLYLASQGVTFWAFSELSNSKNNFSVADKEGKIINFPAKLQTIYPSVITKGALYDLQARFNLNNLVEKEERAVFLNLLEQQTKLNAKQRETLVQAFIHWLSPYEPNQGNNESLAYYTSQKPAYFPAHQLLQNVSEFRLLYGVTDVIYRELTDFIVALPEKTAINFNTASKPILLSLANDLTEKKVEKLMAARGKKGISKFQDIEELLKKYNIRKEHLTLESQYYLVHSETKIEDLNFNSYVVIKRKKDKKGKISTSIISESFNIY